MDINMVSTSEIGNRFKKENVFLATVKLNSTGFGSALQKIAAKNSGKPEKHTDSERMTIIAEKLLGLGIVEATEYDIFYKDETGYTRYNTGIPETFKSDGSDSKGTLINIVPAWDYYGEDQIREATLENGDVILAAEDDSPLRAYNKDYTRKRAELL